MFLLICLNKYWFVTLRREEGQSTEGVSFQVQPHIVRATDLLRNSNIYQFKKQMRYMIGKIYD